MYQGDKLVFTILGITYLFNITKTGMHLKDIAAAV